ncbi:MAG: phenylacetate--CoA ligase family protein, partial [Saccharolobus sp.]
MMVKLLYDETNPRALNKEEIKEVITFRLRSLIKNVYENSPFYHRIFKDRGLRPEDIRSIEDLTKIPFTTKDDLRKYGYPY